MNIFRIGKGISTRLHKYFSYKATEFMYRSYIRKKCKKNHCNPLTRAQKYEVKKYYASFGFKDVDSNFHRYYTHVTGNFFKEYIPEDLFYNVIIPKLNMKIMYPGLLDKNILDKIFPKVLQPKTVIKKINGLYLDGANNKFLGLDEVLIKCQAHNKLIIKPSIDSGGGKNIIVFELNGELTNYNDMSLSNLINLYGSNFIIQKYLIQHERMGMLNPSSVNTLRIKSLIIDNRIEILKSVVRIGNLNSIVDNIMQGGMLCTIKPNGHLKKIGYDADNKVLTEAPTGIKLDGFEIPYFKRITEEVKALHYQVPHFKLISWDIAINSEGETVLIEYNTIGQGYSEESGPLFGEFTDQILSECGKV